MLCEHRCGVDRAAGELGFCKASAAANVFRHRIEYGEELELIPSHLFYLSGCDLRCRFCIAGINAFDPSRGIPLTSEFFNQTVEWGRERGARNIQWVGGEPTIHLPAILDVMSRCPRLPPVVWKSDFHGTPQAFEMLQGAVDVYVADYKFGNDQCARRLAGIEDYTGIIQRNLKIVAAQSDESVQSGFQAPNLLSPPPVFRGRVREGVACNSQRSAPTPTLPRSTGGGGKRERAIALSDESRQTRHPRLIIRHLLLPNHAECCYRPIVQWLRENLPRVPLSLRDSYLPSWRSSRFSDLAGPLDPLDSSRAFALADRLGLTVIQ
jgi:putative pyruvate formate lyase activating enzyme